MKKRPGRGEDGWRAVEEIKTGCGGFSPVMKTNQFSVAGRVHQWRRGSGEWGVGSGEREPIRAP